jgi:hypothetical protein
VLLVASLPSVAGLDGGPADDGRPDRGIPMNASVIRRKTAR